MCKKDDRAKAAGRSSRFLRGQKTILLNLKFEYLKCMPDCFEKGFVVISIKNLIRRKGESDLGLQAAND